MKSILIVIFITLTTVCTSYAQEIQEINGIPISQAKERMSGTYQGFENGKYVFKDGNGKQIIFNNISEEILKIYDLNDTKFIGRYFIVDFVLGTEIDSQDEETQQASIVGLIYPS